MFESITFRRLSAGSVYKLLAIGWICSLLPFSVLMGVLSLFGAETINWNGRQLTGVAGLIASPFVGLFVIALFVALFGSMCAFGLWVYSKVRPLQVVVVDLAPKAT